MHFGVRWVVPRPRRGVSPLSAATPGGQAGEIRRSVRASVATPGERAGGRAGCGVVDTGRWQRRVRCMLVHGAVHVYGVGARPSSAPPPVPCRTQAASGHRPRVGRPRGIPAPTRSSAPQGRACPSRPVPELEARAPTLRNTPDLESQTGSPDASKARRSLVDSLTCRGTPTLPRCFAVTREWLECPGRSRWRRCPASANLARHGHPRRGD